MNATGITAPRLITADERLAAANNRNTIAIFGPAGVGKTRLLYTLPPDDTVCLDLEAGMKSVQGWRGSSIPVRCWEHAVEMACLFGGPDPSRLPAETYSAAHYEFCCAQYAAIVNGPQFRTVFVDSITALTRYAMSWAQQQPEAFSDKKKTADGKPAPDTRGAYGIMGREVIRLLSHLQKAPGKNVVFIGGLDKKIDQFNRETWEPQTEGSKTAAELPYIVDQVATLSRFDYSEMTKEWQHSPEKGAVLALCTKRPNPWGLPAKTRSESVEMIEEPHLGRLFEKMNGTIQQGGVG